MKNYFISTLIFFFCTTILFAQNIKTTEVVLKTGEKYSGEIVFQNEQVIILKQEAGTRFQFSVDDIETIREDSKSVSYLAQENITQTDSKERKITLKTGDIYYGEILVENERIIMIKTSDGNRFQFPVDEVNLIEKEFIVQQQHAAINHSNELHATDELVMLLDVKGGISYSKQAYLWAPTLQASLILGAKDIFLHNLFLGGGIGYNVLFPSDYFSMETIAFFPVFVRLQSIIGKRRTAPYFEMDAGYGFSLSPDVEGGTMLKTSAGIAHKLSYKATLHIGAYVGLQNFSGKLTRTNNFGTFGYVGKTTAQDIGAKLSLQF